MSHEAGVEVHNNYAKITTKEDCNVVCSLLGMLTIDSKHLNAQNLITDTCSLVELKQDES